MLGLIYISIFTVLLVSFGILVAPTWDLKKKKNRIKFVYTIGITIGISVISSIVGYYINQYNNSSNEVWNFYITEIEHWERWTTKETRTETHTDSKGNTTVEIIHYTDTHGPYYYAITNTGKKIGINSSIYSKWMNVWKNEQKIGFNEGSSAGFDTSIDGNIYGCKWNDRFEDIYAHAEIHKYLDYARYSEGTILKWNGTVSEDMQRKYEKPTTKSNPTSIINYSHYNGNLSNMKKINAFVGARKQIHMVLVLFDNKTHSMNSVNDMLTAWQGPNKNELVICCGVDPKGYVDWVKVQSWLDNTTLHAKIESALLVKTLNNQLLKETLLDSRMVQKYWDRKQFEDINYLRIKISGKIRFGIVVVNLVLTLIVALVVDYKVNEQYRW